MGGSGWCLYILRQDGTGFAHWPQVFTEVTTEKDGVLLEGSKIKHWSPVLFKKTCFPFHVFSVVFGNLTPLCIWTINDHFNLPSDKNMWGILIVWYLNAKKPFLHLLQSQLFLWQYFNFIFIFYKIRYENNKLPVL